MKPIDVTDNAYIDSRKEVNGKDPKFKVDYHVEISSCKDIKNILHVDTSRFALRSNLASLRTEVDKLEIDKLVPVLVDLSKLRDVVKNAVVKQTAYGKLAAKVNSICTGRIVLKTNYDSDKRRVRK